MKIHYQLEDFSADGRPLSLTIGNFDGLHLGHQAILSRLTGQKVVLTFSNHPVEVLKGAPFYRLTTTSHRLRLLEQNGIDDTLLLPFTKAFSEQSPEEFLVHLRKYLPFSHLILGHDAAFGRGRAGDSACISELAARHGFTFERLEPVNCADRPVSSSLIRRHVQLGEFDQAATLLGRPYSILAPVEPGAQQGRLLGFQTANLKVHTLCLPPLGVYAVEVLIKGERYRGVANLGHAPTLHAERPPVLEVHLIDFEGDLYSEEIEVVFRRFIRPERRFESIEALKRQISLDIEAATK